jgi:C-terminal processing protease CtpA/Prc
MNESRLFRGLLILALSGLPLLASSGSGWLGISTSIKGSGASWNPTIETVSIAKVAPNSPAENQHLSVGDMIIEVEGTPVLGAKGSDLRSKMKRNIGEVIHLTLMRPNGETYSAVLTAAKQP